MKKGEVIDKKIDYRVKDRGDLKKCNDKNLRKCEGITQMNLAHQERGDSLQKESTNQKVKPNDCVKKLNKDDRKMKNVISDAKENFLDKNNYCYKDQGVKSHTELRKRIRDRYTVKLNSLNNKSDHISLSASKKDGSKKTALKTNKVKLYLPINKASVPAECPKKQLSEGTTQTVEKSINLSAPSAKINIDSKSDRSYGKNAEKNVVKKTRKPVIRTITSKNGPVRIFKAVHFVDQHNTTPLEIKIPGPVIKKQQKLSKYTETTSLKFKPNVTVSKNITTKPHTTEEKLTKLAAVRKRAEKRREKNFFKQGPSPSRIIHLKEPPSPPTEVARWAPASADAETIPYYEAWINTTLAAISKNPQKDKLAYEKKQAELLKSFQKILDERPPSPELFYANCADEKYTGRIRFRQREKSKKHQV